MITLLHMLANRLDTSRGLPCTSHSLLHFNQIVTQHRVTVLLRQPLQYTDIAIAAQGFSVFPPFRADRTAHPF